MIRKVELQNFKRFKDETFEFHADGLTLIAGGNNSGKSSILHALALWDFCRRKMETMHGRATLEAGATSKKFTVTYKQFTPLHIPSFQHLWTNLTSTATKNPIRIKLTWSNGAPAAEHHLEFKLDLPGPLRVEVSSSSVAPGAHIPRLAYLPPFAGIKMQEQKVTEDERERLVGQGLPGAVIRNHVCVLEERSREGFQGLKDYRGRIAEADRARFLRTDSWHQLLEVLHQEFKCMLYPAQRQPKGGGQIGLTVNLTKGGYIGKRFTKFSKYTPRDIAVEGSGFLQWLSVFALAVDRDFDVLLFDEADAHLHSTFQNKLLFRLNREAVDKKKQILYVTHSTEILREADYRRLYAVEATRKGYLTEEVSKVRVIQGLGSLYAPRIEKLLKSKRLLLLEGTSDEALLKIWAAKLGIRWPEQVVVWFSTGKQSERKNLFHELNKEANGIHALSLRDRDEEAWNTTHPDLQDKSNADFIGASPAEGRMLCRKWRRRHIENYLLLPAAIARAAQSSEADVAKFLVDEHSATVNQTFTQSHCHLAVADLRAKEITYSGPNNTETKFGVSRHDIAGAMEVAEVCEDIKSFLGELQTFAAR